MNAASPPASEVDVATNEKSNTWELIHLRQDAEELFRRLQFALERVETLESEVRFSWDACNSWRDNAMALAADLESAGLCAVAAGQADQGSAMGPKKQGGAA